MTASAASRRFIAIQQGLLKFLRAYEAEQELLLFKESRASQDRLARQVGDFFENQVENYYLMAPAAEAGLVHQEFCQGLAYCSEAYKAYMAGRGVRFNNALLESRLCLAKGLDCLYKIRAQLPELQGFWFTTGALRDESVSQSSQVNTASPVGIQHLPASATHAEYSLYVPEPYKNDREWPLIICLHGGYGHGREMLWTWVRSAKSAGYIVVAPKSLDLTWSILNPSRDIDSLISIFAQVCRDYRVDRRRVFLTGLSDGGTFSYLLAFERPELFAGVAPVAGEMHEIADNLVRLGAGKRLPFYVIHGALDHIFPVQTQRSTSELLKHLGYQIRYDELADWGHAYPYQINEKRILPWFESL